MGKGTALLPIILLGSGVALTAVGLVVIFARGPATPGVFFILMLVGILDGLMGLIWTSATILWGGSAARSDVGPGGARSRTGLRTADESERERARIKALLLATGVLCIIFLGILAAIAFQIPLILQWIRAKGIM
jgi:hypothetical protein